MKAKIDNFTESELREIVENSSSDREALLKLGYSSGGASSKTLHNRCEKYNIIPPSQKKQTPAPSSMRLEDLSEGSYRTTAVVKRFILRENLIPYQCSNCGLQDLWCGEKLTLHLDHINGVGNDHRLDNLRFLCPNCHSQTKTYSVSTRTKPEIESLSFCSECGRVVSKQDVMCPICSAKHQRVVDRPSREKLKDMIRVKPFTEIGKLYGVSDNAIKKWCKYYLLPFRKRDIKKLTDEEWKGV